MNVKEYSTSFVQTLFKIMIMCNDSCENSHDLHRIHLVWETYLTVPNYY